MLLSNGLVDKVFKQYEINISDQEDSTTESFGRISLFHAKCGLIELTGQNVLTKDTVTILEQSCDWDRSQKGIDIVQFRKLVRKFEECTFKNDQALVLENLYTAIDTNKKGWIDKEDFLKLMFKVAPTVASNQGDELFAALDIYNTGKIPKPTVMTWLQEGSP